MNMKQFNNLKFDKEKKKLKQTKDVKSKMCDF